MAKCDNVLRSLSTKVKVLTGIAFQSNMGDKVRQGLIRGHKMWQDVMAF